MHDLKTYTLELTSGDIFILLMSLQKNLENHVDINGDFQSSLIPSVKNLKESIMLAVAEVELDEKIKNLPKDKVS